MRFSLRYRLLASFLLLMVITLAMAALPLLVMLRQLPAPREESLRVLRKSIDEHGFLSLADEHSFQPDVLGLLNLGEHEFKFLMSYLNGMELLFERSVFGKDSRILSRAPFSPRTRSRTSLPDPISLERLARSVENMGFRLLVTYGTQANNGRSGPVVLFDSMKRLQQGDILGDFHLDGPITSVNWLMNERYTSNFGDFRDGDGDQWVFYSMNWDWPLSQADAPQRTTVLLAEERQNQWEVLREPLLQSLAVSSLVAVVLAFFISRSIGKPLLAFARAAEAVAEGDLEQRVPVSGPPEMRHAARAFNHMSVQVRATQRAQSDLLANISHDLRTPLTSIQGFSQAIIDGATHNARDAARIIHLEAARLNRMVSGLLDLSRLGEGIPAEAMREVDLSLILERVCERQQIQATEGGIELRCENSGALNIRGDGDLLEQAVVNLVSNALQFTPSGGCVNIRGERRGGAVRIIVEDNGPGIPEEQRERIFERFYQIDHARGPGRGAGLGLSIVQQIAQAHGGSVMTEAREGGGARFIVELPLS